MMRRVLADRWLLASMAMALVYFLVLWWTAPVIGYVRDEGYYFKAAEQYGAWWDVLFSSRFFEAFSDAEIQKHFSYNTEHPALVKILQGLSYRFFHQWLGLAEPGQGYRVTGFLFAAVSVIVTFLLGRALVSARVGLLAAASLMLIPRYFYDAHLACFDVPMAAMWTASLWAFWRAYRASPGRLRSAAIFAGLVFGLALATKLNALFLPFVFVSVWLLAEPVLGRARLVSGPSGGTDLALPAIPWVLIACAVIGPIVFFSHWPYLWHDPFIRTGKYVGFHLHHEHYPAAYLGDILAKPPFPVSFPFVMTYFTAPAPLVFLGGIGFAVAAWRAIVRRSAEDALLLVATFIPMLAIALPNSPIFGGVKHWYNAMPTLAILAARAAFDGFDLLLVRAPRSLRPAAALALSGVMLLPGLFGIAATQPNGIGYYNELAGGFVGGAELGMQRGFWGGLWYPLHDRIETLGQGGVFFNRANYDAYLMYRREGVIPKTIRYSNRPQGARAGLHFEQPEHGEMEGEIWSVMGTRPVGGVYQDNVTLIQLYELGPSSVAPANAPR